MTRNAIIVLLLAGMAILAAGSGANAGDPKVAKIHLGKGDKACRAKEYREAIGHYRKALEETPDYPEALMGLGSALEKTGGTREALDAYRRCEALIAAIDAPTPHQKTLGQKAAKAAGRLGRGYGELERAEKDLAKKCIDYGKRHLNDEPRWAKRAFQIALSLDPENEIAKKYFDQLAHVRAAESREAANLIESDKMPGWSFGGNTSSWSCKDRVIRGDIKDRPITGWLLEKRFGGRYTISFDLRIVSTHGVSWMTGLIFGNNITKNTGSGLLLGTGNNLQLSRMKPTGLGMDQRTTLADHNREEWHTYTIAVDGGKARVSLDGKEVLVHQGATPDYFDGCIGLHISSICAEFRNLKVMR